MIKLQFRITHRIYNYLFFFLYRGKDCFIMNILNIYHCPPFLQHSSSSNSDGCVAMAIRDAEASSDDDDDDDNEESSNEEEISSDEPDAASDGDIDENITAEKDSTASHDMTLGE